MLCILLPGAPVNEKILEEARTALKPVNQILAVPVADEVTVHVGEEDPDAIQAVEEPVYAEVDLKLPPLKPRRTAWLWKPADPHPMRTIQEEYILPSGLSTDV